MQKAGEVAGVVYRPARTVLLYQRGYRQIIITDQRQSVPQEFQGSERLAVLSLDIAACHFQADVRRFAQEAAKAGIGFKTLGLQPVICSGGLLPSGNTLIAHPGGSPGLSIWPMPVILTAEQHQARCRCCRSILHGLDGLPVLPGLAPWPANATTNQCPAICHGIRFRFADRLCSQWHNQDRVVFAQIETCTEQGKPQQVTLGLVAG